MRLAIQIATDHEYQRITESDLTSVASIAVEDETLCSRGPRLYIYSHLTDREGGPAHFDVPLQRVICLRTFDEDKHHHSPEDELVRLYSSNEQI